jgi:hypothetical protein
LGRENPGISEQILDGLSPQLSDKEKKRICIRIQNFFPYQCMNLIGNKDVFAFECAVEVEQPILMVKKCFWIQGKFIGNFEDSGSLSAVLQGLRSLISYRGNFYEDEFIGNNSEKVMLTMVPNRHQPEMGFWDYPEDVQQRLVRYGKYIYNFGEIYDYFILRIYAVNECIIFFGTFNRSRG